MQFPITLLDGLTNRHCGSNALQSFLIAILLVYSGLPASAQVYPGGARSTNLFPGESPANLIPWRNQEFTIVAQNRALPDLFADFGDQQGVKIQVSPTVQGVVSGTFANVRPGDFLNQICRAYGLSWFYVNGLLYIASNSEIQLVVRPLSFVQPQMASRVVDNMGILSSDGRIEPVSGSTMLFVSGLPKHIELIQKVLDTLDTQGQFYETVETVIEVFPLNYAWAYDVELGGGTNTIGGATRVEGVATVLRRLITGVTGGSTVGASGAGFATGGIPQVMQGALNEQQQLGQVGYPGGAQGASNQPYPVGPPGTGPGAANLWNPQITADVRRNAVVIRDTRENMAFYEAAIRKLDVPVRVIEIAAAIVDVEIGASKAFGLNSSGISAGNTAGLFASTLGQQVGQLLQQQSVTGANNLNDINLNKVDTVTVTSSTAPNGPAPNVVLSGVFGTVQVTAALNLLSERNKAKVLSRPTVLTLDNFSAVISRQETFFVNTTGQYVTNLFNVSTGLTLQVVPHITEENGQQQIYMQVVIQDGTLTNQKVTDIPTVRQQTLTTQAVVGRDQSLLIGGLYLTVDRKARSGYPWLKDIPIVGFLFGVNSIENSMIERLFLITPRIVDLASKDLGDYSQFFRPSPTVEQAIEKSLRALPVLVEPAAVLEPAAVVQPTTVVQPATVLQPATIIEKPPRNPSGLPASELRQLQDMFPPTR